MGTVVHRCRIRLKKGKERPLLHGDLRVHKGQIEAVDGDYSAGCEAGVFDYRGNCLGAGYADLKSRIPLRLLRQDGGPLGPALLRRRVERALEYRLRFYRAKDSFRLIAAEADGLPGLVADKYGPFLSLQLSTLGMDLRADSLVRLIKDLLPAEAVVLRNDSLEREREGLPAQVRVVHGSLPRQVEIPVDGVTLAADLIGGPGTGFYLDQRENRRRAAGLCRDKRVLDACCYSGAFAVLAAREGAAEVLGLDLSGPALNLAEQNARLGGVADRCAFLREDVAIFLRKEAAGGGRPFDLIFLDPPAPDEDRQAADLDSGAYRRLNRLAAECLTPGGVLVSSCRSPRIGLGEFLEEVGAAVRAAGREARMFHLAGAAPDHPVLPGMAETMHLQCAFLVVERDGQDE